MKTDSTQLLRKLEPAVRPAGGSSTSPRAPIDAMQFESLLDLVAHGELHSGRTVTCDCELSDPLDDEQLARLANAADLADAAGSERAVMVIDGRALIMNVRERVIDTEISAPGSAKVFGDIDAALNVPRADEGPVEVLLPFPGGGAVSPSVAREMERALLFGESADNVPHAQTNVAHSKSTNR